MSIKDNFRQAVNEMTRSAEKMEDSPATVQEAPLPIMQPVPLVGVAEPQPAAQEVPAPAEQPAPVAAPAAAVQGGETVITRGTVIRGSIHSDAKLLVHGDVYGNIETESLLSVSGYVQGDMSAQSVTLEGARISGNIKAAASVLIHQDSILIGDIAAQTVEVSGKVKGNLLVNEDVKLTNGAYVLGDIAARSISVDSGAIIAGAIKLQVAENVGDPFQIEPQNKSLAKEKKKIDKT